MDSPIGSVAGASGTAIEGSVSAEPPIWRKMSILSGKNLAKWSASATALGGFQFAALGALAVAEVEGVGLVVAGGEGGADGRVHASGEADYGAGAGVGGGVSCRNHHFLW